MRLQLDGGLTPVSEAAIIAAAGAKGGGLDRRPRKASLSGHATTRCFGRRTNMPKLLCVVNILLWGVIVKSSKRFSRVTSRG